MKIKFVKMQGCGNDYVYINGAEYSDIKDKSALARFVSDRHFGIGSDGLIFINPSPVPEADFEMEMYNADGSQSQMCGNGVRCVAKFVCDEGLWDASKDFVKIYTKAGIKAISLIRNKKGVVTDARVNMGNPILNPVDVPTKLEGTLMQDLTVDGIDYKVSCVSMGNPHCVTYIDDVKGFDLDRIGAMFESHEMFPERINAEFVKVIDRQNIEMRVYERGAAETWACGTGACAVAVASILNGLCDNQVTIHLRGGDLFIDWSGKESDPVFMTGPATRVFKGSIKYKE